jgi:hypothetical protein
LFEGSRTGSDDDETLPVSYHKLSANHNHTASRQWRRGKAIVNLVKCGNVGRANV